MSDTNNKIRKPRKSGFSMISNNLVNDDSLPQQSRFLYILLYSQADDWTFRNSWLLKKMNFKSLDTLLKYWRPLKASGWADKVPVRDGGGRIVGNEYVLYDLPETTEVTASQNLGTGLVPKKTDTEKNRDGNFRYPNNTNLNNNTKVSNKKKNIIKGETDFAEQTEFTVRECIDLLNGDDEILFRKHIGSLLYQVLKAKKGQMDHYRSQAGVDHNELPNAEFEKVCQAWASNPDNKASTLAGYATQYNRLGMYTINYLKGRRFVKGSKPKQREQGLPQGFVSPLAGRSKNVDPRAQQLMNQVGSKFKK